MLLPFNLLNSPVDIYRRTSAGRDSLGNPIYGTPTSGVGWNKIYTGVPSRLAFSAKAISFALTGERPTPNGIMYYPPDYQIAEEDRVLTTDGIEYVVVSVVPGYLFGSQVDHYEAVLALP